MTALDEKNPYGAPPGMGISMPPYYLPTPSVKNRNSCFHTPHYGAGYLANLVQPRLAMATHLSFDRELIGEMMAGVRMHYKGLFAFGIDHTVVNVTKDRVWLREAALPETTNIARPDLQWLIQNQFDGKIPTEVTFKNTIADNQEQSVRDLEIDPALFTPKDQMRQWARGFSGKVNLADFFGGGSPPKG